MKLGKIFICINILVLSLLMFRIIYQNTDYNRTIVLDDGDIVETEDSSFCGGTAISQIVALFARVYPEFERIFGIQEWRGLYRTIDQLRIEGTYPYHIRES